MLFTSQGKELKRCCLFCAFENGPCRDLISFRYALLSIANANFATLLSILAWWWLAKTFADAFVQFYFDLSGCLSSRQSKQRYVFIFIQW